MTIKIYCDSADYKIIKKYSKFNLVKGFTTNPSLMSLAGVKNYKNYSIKILKTCKNKPISLEVFSDDINSMIQQAYLINSWGKNVYVKIPVVNTQGKFTGKAIRELSSKGVKLNITAIYTYEQVEKVFLSLNKNTKSIISIFAGRMADVGKDPIPIFQKSVQLTQKHKNIEILCVSTREAYNFLQAKNLGCEIITMPSKIIEKIENFGKDFNTLTLDTVKGFFRMARNQNLKFNILLENTYNYCLIILSAVSNPILII